MSGESLKFVKDNVKYMGFGEKLFPEIEENIRERKPEFSLRHIAQVGDDMFSATLHFKKSPTSDMYFFNKYDATLEKNGGAEKSQTFYLDKSKGVTAREAYNLLDGRSVFKELKTKDDQKYQAWIKLDFSKMEENGNYRIQQYHQNYGYNIAKMVDQLPLKEISADQKSALLKGLEKGNMPDVTLALDGVDKKIRIAANPQFKTLDFFDTSLRSMSRDEKYSLLKVPNEQERKGNTEKTLLPSVPAARKADETTIEKMAEAIGEKRGERKGKSQSTDDGQKKTKTDKVKELLPKKKAAKTIKGLSL